MRSWSENVEELDQFCCFWRVLKVRGGGRRIVGLSDGGVGGGLEWQGGNGVEGM